MQDYYKMLIYLVNQKEWSKGEISKKIGISPSSLTNIINGKEKTIFLLEKLKDFFDRKDVKVKMKDYREEEVEGETNMGDNEVLLRSLLLREQQNADEWKKLAFEERKRREEIEKELSETKRIQLERKAANSKE